MTAIAHDPHRKARTIWFVAVNVISLVISIAVFAGVLYFDGLSRVFEPLLLESMSIKYSHRNRNVPLFASLVGMAYAKRAIKERKLRPLQQRISTRSAAMLMGSMLALAKLHRPRNH